MIDRHRLLSDLQDLLKQLEADLLQRSESTEVPDVGRALRGEFERAKSAERTAQNYEDWRSDAITQAAAAWVLSCVFARFLEDNRLVDPPKIAGPGQRLQRARDEHELYFRDRPKETDRDYLLAISDALAKLPGTKDVFGEHNPVRELPKWLSGDAAGELLEFFQRIDADTGALVHDFNDPNWDTRFLGDLYQDLSEAARKKYALLQTPEFVEEFILDRTLDPALDEFGLNAAPVKDREGKPITQPGFRMIDPACGSGHFLLGTFPRILERWQRQEPGTNVRELVQRTLDSIHGVDVNPYAIAIARFRLLLAAMRACGITRLADSPAFRLNLVCGDSLLHGRPGGDQLSLGWRDVDHVYRAEDLPELRRTLRPGHFHSVAANPPYITPKDRALNQAYRERFSACYMKYSLSVPFMQQIFSLAVDGGFTGQITSNSFMKREFGKKLIEEFLPTVDLTHVIDTSGAYIPGHGTPTVILFGRNRKPVATTIRAAMGISGEPSTPADPAHGLVWEAILAQIDNVGSQSKFVSVTDAARGQFHKHPWSIGGGGAAELKEQIEDSSTETLNSRTESIGFMAITGEDDVFVIPQHVSFRFRLPCRPFIVGDLVRDWRFETGDMVLFPYDSTEQTVPSLSSESFRDGLRFLWPFRECVRRRSMFGKTVEQHGFRWFEYMQFIRERASAQCLIVYGEVATHNHFVLDRGGKVFKQTAPVVKLLPEATEDDHLALLGLLNSSTACFWMKQSCHQKQMMGGDGIRITSKAKAPYAFNATQVGHLPIPDAWRDGPLHNRLLELTRLMDRASNEYAELTAAAAIENGPRTAATIRRRWSEARTRRAALRSQQVLLQEEIDFTTYRMFNLVADDLLSDRQEWDDLVVTEGDRPFCIVDGQNEDGFPVPSGIPEKWPAALRTLWEKRIQFIRNNRELRLIESSMYKRRWIGRQGLFNHQRSDDELGDAARTWLTERLETYFDFDGRMNHEARPEAKLDVALNSIARLTDVARQDLDFMQVGELLRSDPAFDVQALISELVESESVPLLPILTYKATGLRKHAEWERTWELQRDEDRLQQEVDRLQAELGAKQAEFADHPDGPTKDVERVLDLIRRDIREQEGRRKSFAAAIPVPPKYTGTDFLKSDYNRLRGKLDVSKERWVSFPHCEGPDGTLMIAWAGYDHLQLARAISAYYVDIQERLGGRDDPRLVPLLACLLELLPWLKQWHNEPDPAFENLRMGDYFEGFVIEEARELGKTMPEINAWTPPARIGGGARGGSKRRGHSAPIIANDNTG